VAKDDCRMIKLNHVSKYFPTRFGPKYVLKDVNLELPADRDIAILGQNGAGKTTLMRMLGGIDFPSSGKIESERFISWPLGLSTGFHKSMTGRENVRFVCRIHGIGNSEKIEEYVNEFSELGRAFDLPIGNYSSGMRAKFGFSVSMGFDFDTYLMDEITAVGDQHFRKKCRQAMLSKRESSNIILVSHDVDLIQEQCDAAILLAYGRAEFYESVDQAVFRYQNL
jgi:capsular polysaccharide transport system ATP-binding protein